MLKFNRFFLFGNFLRLFVLGLKWVISCLLHAVQDQPDDEVDDDWDEDDAKNWQKHKKKKAMALAFLDLYHFFWAVWRRIAFVWIVGALLGGGAPVTFAVGQTITTRSVSQGTRFGEGFISALVSEPFVIRTNVVCRGNITIRITTLTLIAPEAKVLPDTCRTVSAHCTKRTSIFCLRWHV